MMKLTRKEHKNELLVSNVELNTFFVKAYALAKHEEHELYYKDFYGVIFLVREDCLQKVSFPDISVVPVKIDEIVFDRL